MVFCFGNNFLFKSILAGCELSFTCDKLGITTAQENSGSGNLGQVTHFAQNVKLGGYTLTVVSSAWKKIR